MKKKLVGILVCTLLLSSAVGTLSSANTSKESTEAESGENAYTHTILGEFFTLTTCVPCKYTHRALKNLYKGEYHPFFYTTMVYDNQVGNKWAEQRHDELGVTASPTTVFDGGYTKIQGSNENIEEDMIDINNSIIQCGNRNVKDIDLSLNVEWAGINNEDPEDGETGVPIEQHMTWSNSEMDLDVEVTNNEASQYNGHLQVYVTEVNSSLWDDKWGDPYTFCFLHYAWNEDVTLSSGGTWDDSMSWDGEDYQTGYDVYYDFIIQENTMVIASVFDEDTSDWADETVGVLAGIDTDPKYWDLYFGNTTPPPKIFDNNSVFEWFPHDGLEFDTTYYWKLDIWDNNGDFFPGDEWSFTTRGNDPPNLPSWPIPENGSTGKPIGTNLTWYGGDPDGDDVTYDVYFGDNPMEEPQQVVWNQTETWWKPLTLEFQHKYFWRIVAWDEYGLRTIGDKWEFTTEANVPPNKAIDPYPPDGDTTVPQEDVTLEWNGSDPNIGDTLYYDVYFDDVNPPLTKKATKILEDWYEITYTLILHKTYYWRIDTWDKEGEFTEGDVWQFTCGINNPPGKPTIDGPTTVNRGAETSYDFTSIDPDGHDVMYNVDWGDGNEEFTDYYPNGTKVTLSHTWTKSGTVTIEAYAEDRHGLDGEKGTLLISVPRFRVFNFNHFNLLIRLLERFPNAFPVLRHLLEL